MTKKSDLQQWTGMLIPTLFQSAESCAGTLLNRAANKCCPNDVHVFMVLHLINTPSKVD